MNKTSQLAAAQWSEFPGGISALFNRPLPDPPSKWSLAMQMAWQAGLVKGQITRHFYPDTPLVVVGVDGVDVSFLGNRLFYRFTLRTIERLGPPKDSEVAQ